MFEMNLKSLQQLGFDVIKLYLTIWTVVFDADDLYGEGR